MKICIDAGHGGKDPGALGATVEEKWIALDVANRVAQKLQNSGIDVVMTRDSDYFVELAERANIANRHQADIFISIHCNSSVASACGAEMWIYPDTDKDRVIASNILQRLVERTGMTNRGIGEQNFAVLRLTKMPAVLVELGFISNPQEEQIMKTFDYQDQASTAIVEGIKMYTGIPLQAVNQYSYDDTVNNMVIDGITSPDNMGYWEQVLAGNTPANHDYIRDIFNRYHNLLRR